MIWFLLGCQSIDTKQLSSEADEILEDDVTSLELSAVMTHLEAFDQIGQDNNNNRALGTSGADASLDYVQTTLLDAGYTVWVEDFPVSWFEENSPTVVDAEGQDFNSVALVFSASGSVSATLEAVDVDIPPGTSANSSDSGCDIEDFAAFESGRIALIQRGTCSFAQKVDNAQNAGASAVIIFNEGQADRRDVVQGTLGEAGVTIPVAGVSYQAGVALSEMSTATVVVDAEIEEVMVQNVLAERDIGDANSIVLIGGHLDSVVAGPGINDNGSGSATLLAMAEYFAEEEYVSPNRIRFAFWGAEEVGLVGSTFHVESASDTDLSKILGNLNFDMLASPNFARFIYDGDGDQFGIDGPRGSGQIETWFRESFEEQGLASLETPFDGRSDYGPFIAAGIPAGGLFSGAEILKSTSEISGHGGEADQPYDACYHLACDTLENINQEGLEQMIESVMYTADKFAQSTNFATRARINRDRYLEQKQSSLYWGEHLQR